MGNGGRERGPEDRCGQRVQEDEDVKSLDGKIARRDPAGNQSDQQGAQKIRDDQYRFFRQTIEIDADQRSENNRRDRLEKTNDRCLDRRTCDGIDKPQKGELRDTVADLGDELPPPDQTEVSAQQEVAFGHEQTFLPMVLMSVRACPAAGGTSWPYTKGRHFLTPDFLRVCLRI